MIGAVVLMLSCTGASEPTTSPSEPAPRSSQAEAKIALLYHGRDSALYDEGAAWIRAHPEEAHPALMACMVQLKPGCLLAPAFLGEIGKRESVEPLMLAAADDTSPLADSSSLALAHHPHPEAIASLIALSQSSTPSVRARSLRAIGRHQRSEVCTVLEEGLTDPHPDVRYAALRAADKRSCLRTAALTALLQDSSTEIRAVAETLLKANAIE